MRNDRHHNLREASFTLFEVVIAVGLLAFLVTGVTTVQSNAIYFGEYTRKVTQASWLLKRLMSQAEYYSKSKSFKEMQTGNVKDKGFDDNKDFTYSIEIKEMPNDLITMMISAVSSQDDEEEKNAAATQDQAAAANPMAAAMAASGFGLEQALKQVFSDEPPLMMIYVEVYWPEGAKRNSISSALLIPNQKKLDTYLTTMKPQIDSSASCRNSIAGVNLQASPGPSPMPSAPPGTAVGSTPTPSSINGVN